MDLNPKNVAQTIDHTFLKPDGGIREIRNLCREARDYNFISVALAPAWVKYAVEELEGSSVLVGAAIGFPLGYTTPAVKAFEAREAIKDGAREIDMVVNIGAVKDGHWSYVREEINRVADEAEGIVMKVIFETCYLNEDEMKKLAEICLDIDNVDFLKTSTGFGPAGAKAEHVKLLKSLVGEKKKIKAAGGIRTLDDYRKMVNAGAERIGTSSGVRIIEELIQENRDDQ